MGTNKNRLFDLMGKLNPEFINEDINQDNNQDNNQVPQTNPNYQLKTYGDLKRTINVIKLQQKGKKLAGVAVDAILGALPGIGSAKTAFDVYKAAFSRPDNKKTNTWLDKLDIDDQTSAIVDDTVENGFLQAMSDLFNSQPDNKPLEPNFDMNAHLIEYLKKKYGNRTITGIPPKN